MPKTCPVCGVTYPDSNSFCATDGTTLRAADTDGDLIGSVIADRYLVTDLIGQGGMGKVYLARHVRLPQQAAIKVMHPEQVRDASAIARFNREAANASRIDHDRVARVYDFGETSDGIVYLAMEFVAGRTLKAILLERGPLPPRRAANVVRQIADGLDAAHRLGIVHRDLKPDNVLLIPGDATDGSDDRVKVVDFGIAKALGGEGATEPGLTRTGYVVGTPEFMSPEQLLGSKVDARSDVYALAIVAYQCLTGHLPFDVNVADRGMTARLMNPPRPLSVVRQDVPWPASVQEVFDVGLAREPEARPATAGAFARALSTAIEAWDMRAPTGPIAAPTSTATSPAAPRAAPAAPAALPVPPTLGTAPVRRRSALIGAGVGTLALAVAGAVLFARHSPTPSDSAPVASPPSTAPVSTAPVSTAPVSTAPVSTAPVSTTPVAATSTPTVSAPTPASSRPADAARSPAVPAARTAAAPRPGTPAPAAPTSTSGSPTGARHTLDSLTAVVDPNNPDPRVGRAAAAALQNLLPRLTTATDSAWALVRTVEANLMAGDQGRACTAIRSARTAARSDAQREAVRRYEQALECP